MGCGCKSGVDSSEEKKDIKSLPTKNYFVKWLVFTVLVLVSPIFLGIIIWVLFRTLILDKELDILPLILKLINKDNPKEDIDDDEDIDGVDEEDLIAINVEDISNKYK